MGKSFQASRVIDQRIEERLVRKDPRRIQYQKIQTQLEEFKITPSCKETKDQSQKPKKWRIQLKEKTTLTEQMNDQL